METIGPSKMETIIGKTMSAADVSEYIKRISIFGKEVPGIFNVRERWQAMSDAGNGFVHVCYDYAQKADKSDHTQHDHRVVLTNGKVTDEYFYCSWYGQLRNEYIDQNGARQKGNEIAAELHKKICPWARLKVHKV